MLFHTPRIESVLAHTPPPACPLTHPHHTLPILQVVAYIRPEFGSSDPGFGLRK